MKKLYFTIIFILTLILVAIGCSPGSEIRELKQKLGVDFSKGTISYSEDDHGGFHGDGTKLIKVLLPKDNKIIENIKKSEKWHELPLTEELEILVYGKKSNTGEIGPFIHSKELFFHKIKKGYYFFEDRQKDDTEILSRPSFNFTIAIFDVESNILYYCEQDT